MSEVVVFSPSRYSLYTICVTELLRRSQVDIRAIVVVRLMNPRRFLNEFSRDGTRLLNKIYNKLILRKKAYKTTSYETLRTLMEAEGIPFRRVEDFRDRHGISILYCNSLNDPLVLETLKRSQPELVVFTGGGLVRKEVLQAAGAGVLNCHMGVLPRYRGMDVVEWAILEGKWEQVGMTVHFMDQGVDTGDILRVTRVPVQAGESIRQLRERMEPIMCRQLVSTCLGYFQGNLLRQPQHESEGRQYFIMHPRLLEVAAEKVQATNPPGIEPGQVGACQRR